MSFKKQNIHFAKTVSKEKACYLTAGLQDNYAINLNPLISKEKWLRARKQQLKAAFPRNAYKVLQTSAKLLFSAAVCADSH